MPKLDASNPSLCDNTAWNLLFRLITSDWGTLLLQTWQLLQKIFTERTVGLYEVLDFDHSLELCDRQGKKAIYHKRQTVRLLQDFVTAYTDQAWGIGNIFADYKCSPGVSVDRYRDGHKYRVLISLRETKRRGDTLRINIDRTVTDGFNILEGWSETEVGHRTHHFRTSVIFPKSRHAQEVVLIKRNAGRAIALTGNHIEILPDGRQRAWWETDKPVLFEAYILRWRW